MPSPIFTFRMPQKDRDALNDLAKLYGKRPGGFLADMVGAMCSAEPEKIKAFMGRLMVLSGEQLTLKFNAAVDHIIEPQKPVQKARKQPSKGKEAKREQRAS